VTGEPASKEQLRLLHATIKKVSTETEEMRFNTHNYSLCYFVVILTCYFQVTDEPASKEQLRLLHATIKKVSTETEEMRFNTGIAAMMEFINGANKWDNRCGFTLRRYMVVVASYCSVNKWDTLSRFGAVAGLYSCAYMGCTRDSFTSCCVWCGQSYNQPIVCFSIIMIKTVSSCRPRAALEPFVLLLAPYAPHIAEELCRHAMQYKTNCCANLFPVTC
jgi:leucyl-tRNA synthetase